MLTRREKIIGGLVGAALALLLADWFAIEPYLENRARLDKDLAAAHRKLTEINDLAHERPSVDTAWSKLVAGGLKTDATAGENQAADAIYNWAQQARVHIESCNFERAARSGDFTPIRVIAKGSASSAGIGTLLYLIETAPFPMRVNEVRLAPTKDGTDDLVVNFNVTTVVFTPAPEVKPARPAAGRS